MHLSKFSPATGLKRMTMAAELTVLVSCTMATGSCPAADSVKLANTLFRQRKRDFDCAKWVLKQGSPPTTIHGFQTDNNCAEGIRVASRAEFGYLEMHHGPAVVLISLTVVQDATQAPAPDLLAIAKAQFPDEPPRNQEALQAQMRADAQEITTRSIITHGREIDHGVQFTRFTWLPESTPSAVIRSYRPAERLLLFRPNVERRFAGSRL